MAIDNVRKLIFYAYRDAGIVGEDRAVSGAETSEGLDRLNMMLENYYSSGIYVPYRSTINFTMIPGQRSYIVANNTTADIVSNPIVDLDYAVFEQSGIQYPLEIIEEGEYYEKPRLLSSTSWPKYVLLENSEDESKITFYYAPNSNFSCTLRAKLQVGNLKLETSLTDVPLTYRNFLQVALAIKLASVDHAEDPPAWLLKEYDEMFANIKAKSKKKIQGRPNQLLRSGRYRQDIRNGGYE